MNDLRICRCCGAPLDTFWQGRMEYGTCRTKACDRVNITLELESLYNLSEEYVESCLEAARQSARKSA